MKAGIPLGAAALAVGLSVAGASAGYALALSVRPAAAVPVTHAAATGTAATGTAATPAPVTGAPGRSTSRPLASVGVRPVAPGAASLRPSPSEQVPRLLAPVESPARGISRALLSRLVAACAGGVDAVTQLAIVQVESGGDAWALHDDNDGRIYHPSSLADARALAGSLVQRDARRYGTSDRGVDVGLGQVNSSNFATLRVSAADMLDPCKNLNASATIVGDAYRRERAAAPDAASEQQALRRALSDYNSGHPTGDDGYVAKIVNAALALGGGDTPATPADIAVDEPDVAPQATPATAGRRAPPRPVHATSRFAHAAQSGAATTEFEQ